MTYLFGLCVPPPPIATICSATASFAFVLQYYRRSQIAQTVVAQIAFCFACFWNVTFPAARSQNNVTLCARVGVFRCIATCAPSPIR